MVAKGFEIFKDPQSIVIEDDKDAERDFILSRTGQAEFTGQGIRGVVTLVDAARTEAHPVITLNVFPLEGGSGIPVTVDGNGAFSRDLSPGKYRLVANADGFPETSSRPVYVFSGRYSNVNLALRAERVPHPDTSLEVLILGKSSGTEKAVPLPGAFVSILRKGADAATASEAQTDETGHAVFLPHDPGKYRIDAVRAAKTGFRPQSIQINMPPRDLNEQIVLTPTEMQPPTTQFALTVRVFEHQDVPALAKAPPVPRPINGAAVTVIRGSQVVASGTTSGQGQYVIQLPSGDYSIKASATGFSPAGKTVSVAGKNSTVTFDLTKRSSRLDMGPGLDLRRKSSPIDTGQQGTDGPSALGKARRIRTMYAVEYRLKEGSPWQEYGQYSTTEQAQQALNAAVKQRRIPRGAATRIELRTNR